MTAVTTTPYQSALYQSAPYQSVQPVGRDGLGQLIRAEWTKFRTVRGWVIGIIVAGLITVLIGLVSAAGSRLVCRSSDGMPCKPPAVPVGPGGQAVVDRFHFIHQPMDGDGSITARVSSLTGTRPEQPVDIQAPHELLDPWAKAGLIIKGNTSQGSTYAAVMVTGGHGVRMQYDYTHDYTNDDTSDRARTPAASSSAASPHWLRLTRSAAIVTGYESADGTHWTKIATAHLSGLPSTVQVGLFVTSPEFSVTDQRLGGVQSIGGPTAAVGTFDQVSLPVGQPGGGWAGDTIGDGRNGEPVPDKSPPPSGNAFTVTGSGDIAPRAAGPEGDTIERSLVGVFGGLIAVIVLGAMFITAEYRRGLIRTTLSASPRRVRVLVAKAVVLGGVTFATGVVASVIGVWLIGRIRRQNGVVILPVSPLTELRVVAGTALLLAVVAVLALAIGTIARRSAPAVTTVIVLVVLPYILSVAAVLPAGAANWLLRLTPAAGFAIQQSIPGYSQVTTASLPSTGYFPLTPWAGFAVLCGWTVLALGLAALLLRRRDA